MLVEDFTTCATDLIKVIPEPGCSYSTNLVCAAGNTFDGTICKCGLDRLLNAGACTCNVNVIPNAHGHYCDLINGEISPCIYTPSD